MTSSDVEKCPTPSASSSSLCSQRFVLPLGHDNVRGDRASDHRQDRQTTNAPTSRSVEGDQAFVAASSTPISPRSSICEFSEGATTPIRRSSLRRYQYQDGTALQPSRHRSGSSNSIHHIQRGYSSSTQSLDLDYCTRANCLTSRGTAMTIPTAEMSRTGSVDQDMRQTTTRNILHRPSIDNMSRLTSTPEHMPLRDIPVNTIPEHDRPQLPDASDAKTHNAQTNARLLRKTKTVPAFSAKDAAIDAPLELGEPLIPPSTFLRRRQKPSAPDFNRRDSTSHQHDKDPNSQGLSMPFPPLSVPTYLQLELASGRPSEAYIHRSRRQDIVYESSAAKLERLQNFLLLPLTLEHVFTFGTFACLDAWLYSFTILPLRFLKAVYILCQSWAINAGNHLRFIVGSTLQNFKQLCRNSKTGDRVLGEQEDYSEIAENTGDRQWRHNEEKGPSDTFKRRPTKTGIHRHKRSKSVPSTLLPDDKADILKGLLIIFTCILLMRFDASKAYHNIRGQAAIKLYVIFNVLEVRKHVPAYPRLFSSLTLPKRLPIVCYRPLAKMYLNASSPEKL